jgi:hypothetical protein
MLLILEKRQRPFFQVEKHVSIYIGLSKFVSLDAMLSELSEALFELGFTEIGHFEAPVTVRCSAADAAFHTRSLAFGSRPSVIFEKCPEFGTEGTPRLQRWWHANGRRGGLKSNRSVVLVTAEGNRFCRAGANEQLNKLR